MKRVLFLVHGVGRHDKDWSAEVVETIQNMSSLLQSDATSGFSVDTLTQAVDETDFVQLYYDDLFQAFAKKMLERSHEFISALKFAGLAGLAKLFTSDADEANFVRDSVFDILIYRAMKEHRFMTHRRLSDQIYKKIDEYGIDGAEYSIVAHSLGTAVIHDTLHEMSIEPGSPVQTGLFQFRNLFMVANTSALLRNDYDPRTSNIRPFVAPNQVGYVRFYRNFAHRFDPIAQIYSYHDYMKNASTKRFNHITVEHFLDKNIHGYKHYLQSPKVHVPLFAGLYGSKVVPVAFRKQALKMKPEDTLSELAKSELKEKLKPLVNPKKQPGKDDRSSAIITIAKFLKEII